MKILIIDEGGMGLGFALECQAAGHSVKLFVSPRSKAARTGEGLVPRAYVWEPHMKWADLIFLADNSYATEELDWYFKKGFPIFGCNQEGATWELNRMAGQRIFDLAGIKTIAGKSFTSFIDAEAYVKATPIRYVSKPNGDADRKLSYVAKSAADMVYMLRCWAKSGKIKDEFILQDFMPGVEMSVGGWFGADGWSKALCENWEFKKLCSGEIGPTTGEMGTVLRYTENSKLADEVLFPVTSFLHAIGYIGYCDVNCIIDKAGVPYPLEFTMRPGWPIANIQRQLHRGDPAEWMLDKLEGRDTLQVNAEVAVGVVVAIGDFPHSHYTAKEVEGIPIYGLTKANSKAISLSSAMSGHGPVMVGGKLTEQDIIVSAGDYLCVCSATGSAVSETRDKALKVVKSLEIPDSPIYRTDIGDRLETQLPILQALGYAKGVRF